MTTKGFPAMRIVGSAVVRFDLEVMVHLPNCSQHVLSNRRVQSGQGVEVAFELAFERDDVVFLFCR